VASVNADQIEYWNETSGPKWVAQQALLDALTAQPGRLALERAAPRPGERVLDVGCGCGQTVLELAERVGPTGHVLGVDVSRPMLARARERVREAGLGHVALEAADAQTHGFAADRDLVFSRFGVMFFDDPHAAFVNLRSALRPGGRLAFVCWRALDQNPWMLVPLRAAAQHIPLPPPPDPHAPGPFALADPKRLRDILEGAGFEDIAIEPAEVTLMLGSGAGVERATAFVLEIGPTGALLREAGDSARERVAAAVADALRPYATPRGVSLPGGVWVVSVSRTTGADRA
jgi:SAM-dependent methyltransferase